MSERPSDDPETLRKKRRISLQFRMNHLKQRQAEMLLDKMIERLNGHTAETEPPPGEENDAAQGSPYPGR